MKQGLFKVTYGDNPTVEFIHVSNVCQAMRLTLNDLLKDKSVAVSSRSVCHELDITSLLTIHSISPMMQAGQAYFISDGQPINNFEFFRPLVSKCSMSRFNMNPIACL